MTNIVIGQGDLLVTPLQLCNSYAAFARKKLVTPHIFHQVVDTEGKVVVSYTAKEVEAQPVFEEAQRSRVIDGLLRVVGRDAGFNPIPVPVAGKTGTAEVAGKDDFSWFVGFAPADAPKYCVACLIEQGGSGSLVATNGVIQTMARIYGVDAGSIAIWTGRNER
jgi:penicillin-binding protein 2